MVGMGFQSMTVPTNHCFVEDTRSAVRLHIQATYIYDGHDAYLTLAACFVESVDSKPERTRLFLPRSNNTLRVVQARGGGVRG